MVNLLLQAMVLIFILQFCISGFIISKIYFLYKDTPSLQLILEVFLANVTIITSLLYFNADMVTTTTAEVAFEIALFTILLLIIIMSLWLDKAIYSNKVRLLSKFSFFVISIVLGLILSELITHTDAFFYLKNVMGYTIPYYSFVPSLLIMLGGIAIISSIILSYFDIKRISENLVSKKGYSVILVSSIAILGAFVTNIALQMISNELLIKTPLLNKDFIYFLYYTGLNLLSIAFAYFSYTQPFLILTGGVRPNLLLEKGLLGYYLAYHTDNGPEPLQYSDQFVKTANLSFGSLAGLAVSSIVLVGMFREEDQTFISKVSLIPIPNVENYSALVYTFVIRSKSIVDDRFKDNTPSSFCLLFPSNLTIAIKNMNQTLKDLLEYVNKYEKIEDLQEEQVLISLTTTILRKLLV